MPETTEAKQLKRKEYLKEYNKSYTEKHKEKTWFSTTEQLIQNANRAENM